MNRIVHEEYRELRRIGREVVNGYWSESFSVFLIFSALIGLVPAIIGNAIDASAFDTGILWGVFPNFNLQFLIIIFVQGPLIVGISGFMLTLMRTRRAAKDKLFIGFHFYGKSLLLGLLTMLFIMLWSLLFLIPGIIAAISYSQAAYILYDDPNKSAMQCIRESKNRMRGNKGYYFVLRLSFIGWILLSSIPLNIMVTNFIDDANGSFHGFSKIILIFIASIPTIFVQIYMTATSAAFYEILVGNLIPPNRRPYGGPEGPYRDYNDPGRGPNGPYGGYYDSRRGPNGPYREYDDSRRGPDRPYGDYDDPRRGPDRPYRGYDDPRRGHESSSYRGYDDYQNGHDRPYREYDDPGKSDGSQGDSERPQSFSDNNREDDYDNYADRAWDRNPYHWQSNNHTSNKKRSSNSESELDREWDRYRKAEVIEDEEDEFDMDDF